MFMWTVGYTVGDMMYIAQTTADQRRANWCSKALWVVLLFVFLAYTGYQVYLSYMSYTNPDWSAGVEFSDKLAYPTTLICPMNKRYKNEMKNMLCQQLNGTEYVVFNCSTTNFTPSSGRFAGHQCGLFNGDSNNLATAISGEHSFLEVSFMAELMHVGRALPFAVILYSPTARVSLESPADDSPAFVVVPDTGYWAVLAQEKNIYLSGPSALSFHSSVSSSSAMEGVATHGVVITFSYSSFAVETYSQVVTYDWLSLVGVLGGAAAFACAVHEIIMLVFTKVLTYCCPSLAKKFEDSEEEEGNKDGDDDDTKKPSRNGTTSKGVDVPTSGGKGKGFGFGSENDDECATAARSLQPVDLLHRGFARRTDPEPDGYGCTPTEHRPLLAGDKLVGSYDDPEASRSINS